MRPWYDNMIRYSPEIEINKIFKSFGIEAYGYRTIYYVVIQNLSKTELGDSVAKKASLASKQYKRLTTNIGKNVRRMQWAYFDALSER